MIARVRGRSTFAHLVRTGRRARAGVLWCTFVHDPSVSPPEVAYAIGRAVGTAVVRNRVRRRLRALLAERGAALPPGRYLVGASPAVAARSFTELTFDVDALLTRIGSTTSPASSGG